MTTIKENADELDFTKIKNDYALRDILQDSEKTSHILGEEIVNIHITQKTYLENVKKSYKPFFLIQNPNFSSGQKT